MLNAVALETLSVSFAKRDKKIQKIETAFLFLRFHKLYLKKT